MAKKLAIEWDARELRVVAGITRGDSVTITDISSTPIDSTEPTALGETLKRVLHGLGLEKCGVAIALGRGKAELRELKLPPVPDTELPDMVRFQAVRTFAGAGEKAAIDYLPTRSDADGIRVIAAAVGPEELKNCALIAVPAALTVERIVLRPLAAAALFRRHGKDMAGEIVLIDLLADEADIVILQDGVPSFVRSIRLPEEPAIRIRTLSGEVRRSLMACQEGESDDSRTRKIVLWGRAEVHADEVTGLADSLKTSVVTLDPFSVVDVDSRLKSQLPDHVGRLAPLIGLLDADARGGLDLIDFINPRRPPIPKSNRDRNIIIGVATAALIALCGFFGWSKFSQLNSEIASLEATYDSLKDAEKIANEAIAKTTRVQSFLDGDIFWLDELRHAAVSMPASDKAIVDTLTAKLETAGGGSLTIEGGVTNSDIVSQFEAKIRDDDHRVVGAGTSLVANKSPYDWAYTEKIFVPASYVRRSHEAVASNTSPEVSTTTSTDAASSEGSTVAEPNAEDSDKNPEILETSTSAPDNKATDSTDEVATPSPGSPTESTDSGSTSESENTKEETEPASPTPPTAPTPEASPSPLEITVSTQAITPSNSAQDGADTE